MVIIFSGDENFVGVKIFVDKNVEGQNIKGSQFWGAKILGEVKIFGGSIILRSQNLEGVKKVKNVDPEILKRWEI